jgi:hypothetical protein
MSGETQKDESGWTVTLKEHLSALRIADGKFDTERDRRYSEVAAEREKALKIKETADLAALELAREIQTYKDEKANELREQINSERGLYATKGDLKAAAEKVETAIAPLGVYVASQQGRSGGLNQGWVYLLGIVTLIATIISIGFLLKGN